MKFDFNQVDEIITNIARKYARNTSIDYEDFYQDLWVKAIEIDTPNMAVMTTSLVNKAIDISRKDWNSQNHCTDGHDDWESDSREQWMYKNSSSQISKNTIHVDEYLTLIQNIETLSEKSRIFVIAKAHLNGCEEFDSEYEAIVSMIPSERLELLKSYKKDTYNDDIILKVFCGIKTGTNAGSARAIKNELKKVLLG